MKKRFVLNEDVNDELLDLVLPQEGPTQEDTDSGAYQMISDLIKDEWEAVDGYKSTIATLKSFGDKYDSIIKILEDIFPEELVHVGQLEKAMELVTPQAEQIEDGQEEAEDQLDVDIDDEEDIDYDDEDREEII